MKKFGILLLLILISCQKDEIIVEPTPQYTFIFETQTVVQDNQDIYLNIELEDTYQLVILQNNSVITKETFSGKVGINKRKIFTKTLKEGGYILQLLKGSEILQQTEITVK